jgi:Holliday junction resolvase-like predicted endonuclease
MSFLDKDTSKKGIIGEQFVRAHLESKGFVVYKAVTDDKPHPLDFFAATEDKKRIVIAEVKSKSKRMIYDDTGIDERHFQEYKYIQNKYNMDVFVYFVDEESALVYGNYLKELEKPVKCNVTGSSSFLKEYPSISSTSNGKTIHYWPLSRMIYVADIPQKIKSQLTHHTTKQSQYKGDGNKNRVKAILGSQI